MSDSPSNIEFFPRRNAAEEQAARELLEAQWNAFKFARRYFDDDPTPERWQQLVKARACYAIAWAAVEGDELKPLPPKDAA